MMLSEAVLSGNPITNIQFFWAYVYSTSMVYHTTEQGVANKI